jgi:hypothetical protein
MIFRTLLLAFTVGVASLFVSAELAEAGSRSRGRVHHRNRVGVNTVYGYNHGRFVNRNVFNRNFNNFRRVRGFHNRVGVVVVQRVVRVLDVRTNLFHDVVFERINGYGWTQRVVLRNNHGRVVVRNVIVYDTNLLNGLANHITGFRGYFASNGVVIAARTSFGY